MGSFKDFSNLLPKAAVHTKFEIILGQSWGHTCQGSADIGQGREVHQCWLGD